MCKKQQLRVPKNEKELRDLQDDFYSIAREGFMKGELVGFKDLKEIAFCDTNIITAIHKLKLNKGSQTPGVDEEVIREDILEQRYDRVIERIKEAVKYYVSKSIRRVYIPKSGSTRLRPLGIACITDRIIQECIRNIIEPVLEAQFFDHSYGFRPLRNAHQAYERVCDVIHKTGYHWIIEGDITQFFDTVNHNILLGALYHMGIQDRRILQMIKQMLQAGLMNEIQYNDIGTQQGGIISPLLANVYLNKFDNFIIREWEEKKLKNVSKYLKTGKNKGQKTCSIQRTLRKKAPNMKPAYLVRYADDWCIITNTLENARKLKSRIRIFLKTHLKLELSDRKTRITNIKKRAIKFLGFQIRARAGKSRSGIILQGKPDKEKLAGKVRELKKNIHDFNMSANIGALIHKINLYNCKVRGILNYYKIASQISHTVRKVSYGLNGLIFKALCRNKSTKVEWIKANETRNLPEIHKEHNKVIAAIRYKDFWIGVTSLNFVSWKAGRRKNPKETIYSLEGRELYKIRTGKQRSLNRKDLTLSGKYSEIITYRKGVKEIYNFEFFMNRGYVYNVDKGRCRLCGNVIDDDKDVEIHHINTVIPADVINRVQNLATMHSNCHSLIHSSKDFSNELSRKIWNKVLSFRNKLKEQKL
jgi:group II intron reverse transcriptase/maturase